MVVVGVLFFLALVAFAVWSSTASPAAKAKQVELQRQQSEIVCPHCQTKGQVTARVGTAKRGVSGGKATGALLTGGTSLFATGLSRKQVVTQMFCGNCGTSWVVD